MRSRVKRLVPSICILINRNTALDPRDSLGIDVTASLATYKFIARKQADKQALHGDGLWPVRYKTAAVFGTHIHVRTEPND